MPNTPQDRKPKKSAERFSFVHKGKRYTFNPTYDVLTPGFLREEPSIRDESLTRRSRCSRYWPTRQRLTCSTTWAAKNSPKLCTDFVKHLEMDLAGGILGLLDVVDEHREAIERDLVMAGLRLRDWPTAEFTYRDFVRADPAGAARFCRLPGDDRRGRHVGAPRATACCGCRPGRVVGLDAVLGRHEGAQQAEADPPARCDTAGRPVRQGRDPGRRDARMARMVRQLMEVCCGC